MSIPVDHAVDPTPAREPLSRECRVRICLILVKTAIAIAAHAFAGCEREVGPSIDSRGTAETDLPRPAPPTNEEDEVMQAGIRTPAEVIALAIEDAGIPPDRAALIAEDAARRLVASIAPLSTPSDRVVCYANGGQLEWGTIHFIAPAP